MAERYGRSSVVTSGVGWVLSVSKKWREQRLEGRLWKRVSKAPLITGRAEVIPITLEVWVEVGP